MKKLFISILLLAMLPFAAVEAQDARGREHFFQFPHDLLRARARIGQMHAAAFGTGAQHAVLRAAIVAF